MFHWFKKHTKEGLEVPDNTPIEVALKDRPLTLAEQIRRFTTSQEVKDKLRQQQFDTFDEADDFDTGDLEDDDFKSPFEDQFEGSEMGPGRVRARLDEQKAGMTEEMPIERLNRANERLSPKNQRQANNQKEETDKTVKDVKTSTDIIGK